MSVNSRLRKYARHVVLSAGVAFVALVVAFMAVATMADRVMESWGKAYASWDVDRLPTIDVALVLGTLIDRPWGGPNPTFTHRLDAAAELWRAGKVRYLIVSGNRENDAYDEPTAMRDLLVRRGVPAEVIYRDFAGFRTVTSIVRARDIYSQQRLIVVSQRDHVERALFLARQLGVEAWGYNALDGFVPNLWYRPLRNNLVRLYAYWDLVTGPRPANGPRVAIGVDRPG